MGVLQDKALVHNSKMTIGQNLQTAMRRIGLSDTALGKLAGVPQSTINRIRKGEVIPQTFTLQKLAPFLGVSVADLLSDNFSSLNLSTVDINNIRVAPPARRRVPVISLIRAGKMKTIEDLPEIGEGERWESPENKLGGRGWAHIVEGDSMDDGTEKGVPAGYLIFVDPDISPETGNLVIAKDVTTQGTTFKKLVNDGGRWFLQPLNKQYVAQEIDSPELRVIGVVTESRAPARKHR